MAIPARGLRHIRTLRGNVGAKARYKDYMQVTCLEMEKARRNSERQSASRRIAEIDHRLREIEAEKADLLKAVTEESSVDAAEARRITSTFSAARRGKFKIRY